MLRPVAAIRRPTRRAAAAGGLASVRWGGRLALRYASWILLVCIAWTAWGGSRVACGLDSGAPWLGGRGAATSGVVDVFDSTLGFPGEGPEGLRIASLNVTAWTSWLAVAAVEAPAADIWLLQEHKLTAESDIDRARVEMSRMGMTAVLDCGVETEAGGKSSGAAVAFSQHAEMVQQLSIAPRPSHRAKGARLKMRGLEMVAWSVYGDDKDEVITRQVVLEVVASVPADVPVVIGGGLQRLAGPGCGLA